MIASALSNFNVQDGSCRLSDCVDVSGCINSLSKKAFKFYILT